MLQASAAVSGGAALLLAGCGGGGSDGPQESASGLVSKPEDTTSKAKSGGIYQGWVGADAVNFDAIAANNAGASGQTSYVYGMLVRNKMVKSPNVYDGQMEPDIADSWEVSGDGLQYTFKLRPNVKWDARAPTNSRLLDAQDVKWSFDRFENFSGSATVLMRSKAEDAPILSVDTPDSRTVVLKLAYPYAAMLPMVGYNRHVPIMPREAEPGGKAGTFDFRQEMRGSGAWRLDSYQPSQGYKYRRNPDYYDAKNVYLDGIDVTIMPEYATQLAQLKTGGLWSIGIDGTGVRAEDIISTKRDIPDLVLKAQEAFSKSSGPPGWFAFGTLPDSPFIDDRVRRAISMLTDRDLYVDTFFNLDNYRKEGLEADTRWNSSISSGEELWVDPKGKGLGDGAANYQHNPAEAKKLIQAAGHTKPIELPFNYNQNGSGYLQYGKYAEVFKGMWEEGGDFKWELNPLDYSTVWLPKYHYGNGKYPGIGMGATNTYPEIDGFIQAYYRNGSIRVWHAYEDSTMNSLIDRQRQELNREKRVELIKEFQRYTAKTMPSMIGPGQSIGYGLVWPWIGNHGVYRGASNTQQSYSYLWYDESKKKA